MDILQVLLTSLGSLVVLFLLTKLMGNKQLSQLSMFDYIVGITIGSIAAELATELETPLYPLVAMALYGLAALTISILTNKSLKLRSFFAGRPIVLLDKGRLDRKGFIKARLDLDEFLSMARSAGYFDVSQLETAQLECNGSVSFLPKEQNRPVTPKDLSLNPAQSRIPFSLVLDGAVSSEALRRAGVSEEKLLEQLRALGYENCRAVFLASVNETGQLTVYGK